MKIGEKHFDILDGHARFNVCKQTSAIYDRMITSLRQAEPPRSNTGSGGTYREHTSDDFGEDARPAKLLVEIADEYLVPPISRSNLVTCNPSELKAPKLESRAWTWTSHHHSVIDPSDLAGAIVHSIILFWRQFRRRAVPAFTICKCHWQKHCKQYRRA